MQEEKAWVCWGLICVEELFWDRVFTQNKPYAQ